MCHTHSRCRDGNEMEKGEGIITDLSCRLSTRHLIMASVCPVRPVMLRGIPKSKIGRDWASSASVAGGATANPSDIAIDEEDDEKEVLGRNASIVLPRKAKLLKV